MYIPPFKGAFLLTTSNDSQLYYYNFCKVRTFSGEDERSCKDGLALYPQFYTPTGIAVKLDNVDYVRDSFNGSIKLITPLKTSDEFLDDLHSLAKVFYLYEKHASYSLKTIDKTIKVVERLIVSLIQNDTNHIRHGRSICHKTSNRLKEASQKLPFIPYTY